MKLSQYAKKNSLTYRGSYNHWKRGLIVGRQLATGIIIIEEKSEVKNLEYCIYCRVSSNDQKRDLVRQQKRLEDFCSVKGWVISKIYSEIASGLNDNRPRLTGVLLSDYNIVVEHRDRLTRFGFNYIRNLMDGQGRKVIVINETEDKEDLIQDFVSVITSMCARIYGKRRSKRKTEKMIEVLNENQEKQ